jgi:hypothetical protein
MQIDLDHTYSEGVVVVRTPPLLLLRRVDRPKGS